MGQVWVISDMHLFHQRVAESRGFSSPEEHDAILLDNYCKVVKPDDIVINGGDLTVGGKQKVLNALEVCRKLPGKKISIPGNHDPWSPIHRDAQKWFAPAMETFCYIAHFMRKRLDGTNVLFSHYPYAYDHFEVPRYMQYRLPNLGEFLVHGHGHDSTKMVDKQINVCPEAWDMKPVSQEEILELIRDYNDRTAGSV